MLDDEAMFIHTEITPEFDLKCTRNGCILEVIDIIHNNIENLNQNGPKKETMIFIGTYFGNLVAYKIIPHQTAVTFGYELMVMKQWKFNSQITSLVWTHQFNQRFFWHYDSKSTQYTQGKDKGADAASAF